jgi:glyoxylase-like metal-dependent hydrolase (beta-lactamase superfamily II)
MIDRILAPNPGPFTGPGTNTYVVRHGGSALVIDPGPVIDAHAAEIVRVVGEDTAVGVLATHTHPDHAPLANPLARTLDVPVYGFGPGPSFEPDIRLSDGDSVGWAGADITAVHTPGHTDDHLCFRIGETLFTGDHIMEGSTVIIEDASVYLESLYRVRALGVARLEPGHGSPIDDAGAAIEEYIDHRLMRERQIVDAIRSGADSVDALVDVVYAGIPDTLRAAATHQVRVQLIKLSRDGAVWFDDSTDGPITVHRR